MKSLLRISLILLGACACAGCATSAKNPWAPPEKKKPLAERWDEKAKEKPESAPAAAPEAPVSAPESREVAEVVEIVADGNARFAVAWRLGGIRVPLRKGEIFAVRGKDLALRGAVRLDLIDGETLGFALTGGTAAAGDFITLPGETLRAELDAAFPRK